MSEGNPGLDMGALRQQAWSMFENQLYTWMDDVRAEIIENKEENWPAPDAAVEQADDAVEAGYKEEAITDAFAEIQDKVIIVMMRYIELQNNPQMGMDGLKAAVRELLKELHNPSTREAMLLCVEEEYRDDIRDRFIEFGQIVWGMLDVSEGIQSEEMWFVTKIMASTNEDMDIEEVIAGMNVDPDEVPDWVYE